MGITFAKPPVNEVVIGQVFVPRADLLIARLGEFWAIHLKERYPDVSHGMTVATANEAPFCDPLTGLPLPRMLFTGNDPCRLLQLQQDRLYANWRRMRPDSEYVRFPAVQAEYFRVLGLLNEYLASVGAESVKPVRYELTYVNVFQFGQEIQECVEVGKIFKDFGWGSGARFLPKPTKIGAQFEFEMPDETGVLTVQAGPGRNTVLNEDVIRLQLAAIAPTEVVSKISFEDWLIIANEQIVQGFKDLTTEEMHARWELQSQGGSRD